MKLKEYRITLGITIEMASQASQVPLRTYKRYEADEDYGSIIKRKAIMEALKSKYEIAEDKGILKAIDISYIANIILSKYSDSISFCYLFGSYAKGYANESSDVDLCISTTLTGLQFIGLIEELRNALHKRVDLIRFSDLSNNMELIEEILKDGIKIYG